MKRCTCEQAGRGHVLATVLLLVRCCPRLVAHQTIVSWTLSWYRLFVGTGPQRSCQSHPQQPALQKIADQGQSALMALTKGS